VSGNTTVFYRLFTGGSWPSCCVGRSCISWQLVPVPDGLGEERITEGLTTRSFLIKAIFASSPAVVGLPTKIQGEKCSGRVVVPALHMAPVVLL
jgi:hypothetical protein